MSRVEYQIALVCRSFPEQSKVGLVFPRQNSHGPGGVSSGSCKASPNRRADLAV